MSRPERDQAAVAHALTGRKGDAVPALVGFAACAITGFVVGLLVRHGWASAGLVASLLLVAGVSGWILRGVR